MRLRIAMVVITTAFASSGQVATPQTADEYMSRYSAMAQYRSIAESTVLQIKKNLVATNERYNTCRASYAAAEEAVEFYLDALGASIKHGRRDVGLVSSADQATRAAEQFFACGLEGRTLQSRILPVAPFVEFAWICLDHFFSSRKKASRDIGETIPAELRWKPWDRLR